MSKTSRRTQDAPDKLQKALASIGIDKETLRTLTSSKSFERIVVPIYWRDGTVTHVQKLWLQKVPEFVRGFNEEFPDGQVRWDSDFESDDPSLGDSAIRIYFSYQEDDQGDHWSPPPTLLDEESYNRMVARAAFKGEDAVMASKVLHAK